MTECLLCARRGIKTLLDRDDDFGRACRPCRRRLARDLQRIVELVAIASWQPDPYRSKPDGNGARSHPGSRPPIDLDHVDPELVLVVLEPGEPSSKVPLLELLEAWERGVREDRGLVPYGVVSESRHPGIPHPSRTLVEVVGFLTVHVDWMTTDEHFELLAFAGQVRRSVAVLRQLDPSVERTSSWRIPCPADVEVQVELDDTADLELEPEPEFDVVACSTPLRILRHEDGRLDLHSDIYCPSCGTEWTAQRLLLVALADPRVTIWAEADAIHAATGIPLRTIRDWGARGRIPKRGAAYDAGAAFRARHAGLERSPA